MDWRIKCLEKSGNDQEQTDMRNQHFTKVKQQRDTVIGLLPAERLCS